MLERIRQLYYPYFTCLTEQESTPTPSPHQYNESLDEARYSADTLTMQTQIGDLKRLACLLDANHLGLFWPAIIKPQTSKSPL